MKNNLLYISAIILGVVLMISGCSSGGSNNDDPVDTNPTGLTGSFDTAVKTVFAQGEDAEAISFEGTTLANEEQDTEANFDSLLN